MINIQTASLINIVYIYMEFDINLFLVFHKFHTYLPLGFNLLAVGICVACLTYILQICDLCNMNLWYINCLHLHNTIFCQFCLLIIIRSVHFLLLRINHLRILTYLLHVVILLWSKTFSSLHFFKEIWGLK